LGDGATRSRIEAGWHPNWERARRKKKKKWVREHSGFQYHEQCSRKACESDVTSDEDFELDYIALARRREERDR